MKYAAHILWKTMVIPFFQRNSGLFLFLFVALFGAAQNPRLYHYQLMQSILLSPVTLSVVMTAWLLYGFKTLSFVTKKLQADDHIFIKQLQALAPAKLFFLFTGLQTILIVPIWVYAVVTAGVGFYTMHVLPAAGIIIFMLLLIVAASTLCYRSLMGNGTGWQLPELPFSIPKPFYTLLLWHSFYKGKMKMLGVKLASFTVLLIPLLWNAGHNNLSDFILFYQVAIAAHALVAYDYVQFLETDFPGLRNLPVSRIKIFLLFPVAYLVLLLPEAAILFYYVPSTGFGAHPLSLLIYFIGQLVFIGSIAYEKNLNTSEYSMAVGVISVCSFFILPLTAFWVIGVVLALAGFVIFYVLYYKYEPVYVEDGTGKGLIEDRFEQSRQQ
ncbi:MAG: hypothetical protein ABIX01_11350 [Chitinophagaceae bacterium]